MVAGFKTEKFEIYEILDYKVSNKKDVQLSYFVHYFLYYSKLLADLNNNPVLSSLFITADSLYSLLPLHGPHVLKYYCLHNCIF